jgi:hypothetical protein
MALQGDTAQLQPPAHSTQPRTLCVVARRCERVRRRSFVGARSSGDALQSLVATL